MKHISKIIIEFVKYAMASTNWRERYVEHTTPTGKRNMVKIKSLPLNEQEKYRPIKSDYEQKLLAITSNYFNNIKQNASNISNIFNNVIRETECCDDSIISKYIKDVSDVMNTEVEFFSRKLRQEFEVLRNKESVKLKTIPRSSPEFQQQINKVKQMDIAYLSFLDYKRNHLPEINLQNKITALPQGKKTVKSALVDNKDTLIEAFKQWGEAVRSNNSTNVFSRLLELKN